MQILVVDNALMIRKVLTKILIEAGHESITATSGKEALKLIDEFENVKIIISSWNMPGMDGIKLLMEIRKKKEFQTIPFYLISARAYNGDLAGTDQQCIIGFISKPFTPEDIIGIVKKHMQD